MSVPTAAVLYMTYPLFTLIIGWLFFQDRPTPRAIFGSVLILAAALLATSQAAPAGTATVALTGFALFCGLTAPVSFGLAINVLARRLTALSPLSRMAAFTGGSVIGLLPLILTYPASAVFPADSAQWLLVLALGLGSALIPQLLYNAFVPRIGAPSAAALGSIELPTMFAIGWIALGDSPGPREIAAGVLVLTAILLTPAQNPIPQKTRECDMTQRPNLPFAEERADMAAAFRWTARLNMHESVANHLSLAVNADGTRFLINPNARHFARIRASDMLELDANDPTTMDRPDAPDPTAWGLHGSIHRACPHARCLMHVHSTHATVLASLADSRLPAIDQNSAMFFGPRQVVDDHFGGMAFGDEGARCATLLADPQVTTMIMGNHGVLIIGRQRGRNLQPALLL